MNKKHKKQPSYFQRLRLIKQGVLPKEAVAKEKKILKKVSDKRAAKLAEQKIVGKPPSKLELDVWFNVIKEKHWKDDYCPCMECGIGIPRLFSRYATAHLLPKKLFTSVATHPLNYLILGATCGDHNKTDRLDKFVQMKVWPEAARRIKLMIPELPFDELKYLSSQLLTALDNT